MKEPKSSGMTMKQLKAYKKVFTWKKEKLLARTYRRIK